MNVHQQAISQSFIDNLSSRDFPCVIARNAATTENVSVLVAGHMACPKDDQAILDFIYSFTGDYRISSKGFKTAVVIFESPSQLDETEFERYFWQRLNNLRVLDSKLHGYDARVSADASSENFSYSIGEESFFVIGMHPASSRPARRFGYPVMVFNPHQQFEEMKKTGSYKKTQAIVRKRDLAFSGSVNPMLADFGSRSEAFQYTGKTYEASWQCPLFKTQ